MADITWQYLISLAMIAVSTGLPGGTGRADWRRERRSTWFEVKALETAGPPVSAAPRLATTQAAAAEASYGQYLQELGQLQQALASYAAAPVKCEEKAIRPL